MRFSNYGKVGAFLSLALAMSCGKQPVDEESGLRNQSIPIESDGALDLGVGFDTVKDEARGYCVTGGPAEPVFGGTGQEVNFQLQKIEDYRALHKALNVSASASLKAGIGQASGRGSFAEQVDINRYSIYVMVKVAVKNPTMKMKDAKLTQEAWDLMDLQGSEAFRTKCGDEFVTGYVSGGELIGLVQISTYSKKHQKDISAKIAGSYGSFNGSASFKQALVDISKSSTVKVYFYKNGGDQTAIPVAPDDLIAKATEFPAAVGASSTPYTAVTVDYQTLTLPTGQTPIDIAQQKDTITRMADYRFRANNMLNDVDYVLGNQSEFIEADVSQLNSIRNQLAALLNAVNSAASSCFASYQSCQLPDDLVVPEFSLPARIDNHQCETPQFFAKRDPLCGVEAYQTKVDKVCGAASYHTKKHKLCGVASYHSKAGAACGVKQYKAKKHKSCGTKLGPMGVVVIPLAAGLCTVKGKGIAPGNCEKACKHFGYNGYNGINCFSYKTCRKKSFGVESYKTCAHASFGVKEYKSCAREEFGAKTYKSCQHPSFGVAAYNECRRESFGMEKCLD